MSLKNRGRRSKSSRREPSEESRSGEYRRRTSENRKRLGIVGPVVLVCAAIAVIVMADYWVNSGRVYRGVEVGSIALGGNTPERAEAVVTERTSGALKQIKFDGPEPISLGASEMGVDFDVKTTVDNAYAVGREGGILRRLGERADAAFGDVRIEPEVEYRREVASRRVEEIAARLDAEPKEAEVGLIGSEVEVVESAEGYRTDKAATLKSADAAVADMTGKAEIVGRVLDPETATTDVENAAGKAREAMSEQMVLNAAGQRWTLSPADIGATLDITKERGELDVAVNEERMKQTLGNVYAALTIEPVEADYDVLDAGVFVVPSETGQRIDEGKLLKSIESGIFTGQREYEVPLVKNEPDLTTAEAEEMKPTDLVGDYKTNYLTYDDTPGRIENLKIASNAVNNILLAPGEVFSFNALTEPLDYAQTKVIVNGRVDTAEGGGLCQVSSTLYMAANLAGMETVERQPHYAELPYIRPGFDATVWFGAIDYKFKNNTDAYVLVKERVDESTGDVVAEIWGQPTGKEVEMSSEKVATTEDEEGNPVTKWVTYQKVTKDGEVLSDGVLHTDTYKYLKPAAEEEVAEGPPQ